MKQIEKNYYIGKWSITKMSEWGDDYVDAEIKAFIKIEKSGIGEFHFGYVQCATSVDFKKTRDNLIYDFTFEGNDECNLTNGDGWMRVKRDGTAEGKIIFHMGTGSKFWAKREKLNRN